jgi:hypothetical protein
MIVLCTTVLNRYSILCVKIFYFCFLVCVYISKLLYNDLFRRLKKKPICNEPEGEKELGSAHYCITLRFLFFLFYFFDTPNHSFSVIKEMRKIIL